MGDAASGKETFKLASAPGWWAPALLDLLAWPALIRRDSPLWWVIDAAAVALLLVVLYLLMHPTLRYSSLTFTVSRGPFRTSIDLRNLTSVRVLDVVRRGNVIDPQTGERRSNIRWIYKSPDDWGGRKPVRGYIISDADGHRMSVSVAHTGAPWATVLLSALNEQPDVELGPSVVASLKDFAR
jgi:hypothetical protein